MKLKQNIDLEAFFDQIHQCRGTVCFHSCENDILNLRSMLCLYLLSVSYAGKGPKLTGQIVCQLPEDEARLADFLEDDPT